MVKVKYHESGINYLISSKVNDAISNIEYALYYCPSNVSSKLKCASYLLSLRKTLDSYKKNMEKMLTISKKTDEDLMKLFNRIDKMIQLGPLEKVPPTSRLIK